MLSCFTKNMWISFLPVSFLLSLFPSLCPCPFCPETFPLFLSLSSRSPMEYSADQAKEHRLLLEENREYLSLLLFLGLSLFWKEAVAYRRDGHTLAMSYQSDTKCVNSVKDICPFWTRVQPAVWLGCLLQRVKGLFASHRQLAGHLDIYFLTCR